VAPVGAGAGWAGALVTGAGAAFFAASGAFSPQAASASAARLAVTIKRNFIAASPLVVGGRAIYTAKLCSS
jgi:hypothetical protein